MSWKIEKIFTDTGSELSTAALSTSLGQSIQSCYDGRFMWVTCTNGVAIYEFWGQSSGDEPTVDEVDDLLWQRYTEEGPLRKLKLITFISVGASQVKRSTRYLSLSVAPGWTGGAGSTTVGATTVTFTANREDLLVATEVSMNSVGVALSPYWIAKVGDKMVVSNGANFSRCWVFDIATQRPESSFEFPLENIPTVYQDNPCDTGIVPTPSTVRVTANSNMIGSNGRIWFVNTFYNDSTPQRLFNYRLSDSTLGSTAINVRPSDFRTWLADGFNGHIYITNYNGVSVTKYDYATGAQVTRIRTNAFPTKIFGDQNRQIFVASYGGMLTLVDWDDDGVHNDYSAEYTETDTLAGFASDPTDTDKVWFVQATGGKVSRYSLSTKQQYETGVGEDDWTIRETLFATPDWIETIPSRTYTTSTGVVRTVRPYMFICDGGTVRLFAMDNYLVRDNYFEVNGQGAVVGGALTYFGEGP